MENLLNSLARFIDLVVASITSVLVLAIVSFIITASIGLILIIKENIEERKNKKIKRKGEE